MMIARSYNTPGSNAADAAAAASDCLQLLTVAGNECEHTHWR